MKKLFTDRKWKPWTPCFVVTVVGIIMYIATVATHGFDFMVLNQFFWSCAALYLVPIFGLIAKRHFSTSITYGLAIIIFFALFCERLFDIYDYFPEFDKIMHTIFGVVGAGIFYALLLRWNGEKLTPIATMLILIIGTLGFGVIWELFEYLTAFISGDDPQVWHDAVQAIIDAGGDFSAGNPMRDTMEDLMVTAIGSIGFCIGYIIDLLADNGKVCKKIFGEGDLNSDPLPLETPVKDAVEPLEVAETASVFCDASVDEISVAAKVDKTTSEDASGETETTADERPVGDGISGPGENRF